MEKIDDIVREMRYGTVPKHQTDHELLAIYADRIEAAWEREAKAIATENAVLPAVCITKPVGNAAKMREALEKIIEIAKREWNAFRETAAMYEMHKICTAALAAAPRNCDAFSKAEVLEELDDRSFSKEDTIEWLFEEAEGEAK